MLTPTTPTVIDRRTILQGVAGGIAAVLLSSEAQAAERPRHVLLRSSWQTVNIGDIAHTPGMLALLERHLPDTTVTLWPNKLSASVEAMLRKRFPRLRVAASAEAQTKALTECDFALHGSGPGLVGWREMERWRATGKPYGFGGVTLSDAELKDRRELLAGAAFLFCRDTLSLAALKASGIQAPIAEFGPPTPPSTSTCATIPAPRRSVTRTGFGPRSSPVSSRVSAGLPTGKKDGSTTRRSRPVKRPRTSGFARSTMRSCAPPSLRGSARPA